MSCPYPCLENDDGTRVKVGGYEVDDYYLSFKGPGDADVQKTKERVRDIIVAHDPILYSIINNAGISDPGDFLFFHNLDTYQKIMDVNFFGQLRLTQAILPTMLRTSKSIPGGARILNLSSVCGASATASNSAYNASKFAVEAWSDALRLEVEPFNVKIVKIRPGQACTPIQNDFTANMVRNYMSAPDQIRELYDGDAYLAKMKEVYNESMSAKASNPSLVVETLKELLEMDGSKLKPHYWIGTDAHTLWRAVHSLPTTVSDSMKRLIQVGFLSCVWTRSRWQEEERTSVPSFSPSQNGLANLHSLERRQGHATPGQSRNCCERVCEILSVVEYNKHAKFVSLVSNITVGMAIFEKFGFVTMHGKRGDQIKYNLATVVGIKEGKSSTASFHTCKLSNDRCVATVLAGDTPKSELNADALLNTLTISVRDVESALVKAREVGMKTAAAKYVELPVFGMVHIGTAYVEDGANPIEFCCFTNKLDL